jgi:hypothetical protein
MERVLKINPQAVVSVVYVGNTFKNEEIKENDSFRYICSLVTNEKVLMEYDPLENKKQYIKDKYAVIRDKELNIIIQPTQTFLNYYGIEIAEISEKYSDDEVLILVDTEEQATNYVKSELV